MTGSEGLPSASQACPACDGNTRNGVCVDCGLQPSPDPRAHEKPETPTIIEVRSPPPPFTFFAYGGVNVSGSRALQLAPPEGVVGPVVELPCVRPPRREGGFRAIFAVLVVCVLGTFANLLAAPAEDPLESFSSVASMDASGAGIDEWAIEHLDMARSRNVASLTAQARAELEREMAQSLARVERGLTDWRRVAVWANIAQALGFRDLDMLELSADLNVQLVVHAPGTSRQEALIRIARARVLLCRLEDFVADSVQAGRLARKLSDLDALELAISHNGGTQQ